MIDVDGFLADYPDRERPAVEHLGPHLFCLDCNLPLASVMFGGCGSYKRSDLCDRRTCVVCRDTQTARAVAA